jgi:hypothetical protein
MNCQYGTSVLTKIKLINTAVALSKISAMTQGINNKDLTVSFYCFY